MCALAVFPRKEGDDALARPTREAQIRLQSIVILVVAILSILGAGWIMLSFWVFPNLRSFRHRLILGLAISDFIMALNFLFSTTMNIAGRFIDHPENTAFCSFNGFITQVFVIQTDYWVLTIAVCTYFVLAGHKRPSSWVQDHGVIIWAIPWFFSTLWASLGLAIVGYEDIGAWCWFGSDWIRLAVNFFPRWVIIVTMFLLYAYLWTILYKAHNRLSSVEAVSPENLVSGNATPIVSQPSSFQGSSFRGDLEGRSSGSVRRLKKIARLMLLYPLAYAIIWSLPTAIRIYNATEKKPAPFALQTLDKASIVIQGFVDAVIYGVNETSLSSWRLRLSRKGYPIVQSTNVPSTNVNRDTSPRPNNRRLHALTISDSTESTEPGRLEATEPADGIELRDFGNQAASTETRTIAGVDVAHSKAGRGTPITAHLSP